MRAVLAVLALVVLSVVPASAVPASAAPVASASTSRALYLVQVAGAPAAGYAGGVPGIAPTKPTEGAKLDRRSWNYRAYREYLRRQRARVLAAAGVDRQRTVAEYTTVFNGFAARLTTAEVAKLQRTSGVVHIWKNEIRKATSVPSFLGLDGPSGVWNTRFGGAAKAGEGVIIGVIDSGFWPENPSFAALPEPRPDAAVIQQKWFADGVDKCDEGVTYPITCNNKVIGARYYDASGLGEWPGEFKSPRDYDGHGSHTAGTAAGDAGVPATINGEHVGAVSGMAPAARLAIYKALWQQADGEGSGGTVDLVQAIDDAVTDGVDVINFSVSGSSSYVVDPVSVAFFNAAAAGVFVAAAAGNDGPEVSTVAHNAPWVMTVGADSHDTGAAKSVTLGNGHTYTGVGHGPAVRSAPLVDAVGSGLAGAAADKVELCYPGTLDPAKVKGKIVLCRRGVNPRTDKSIAVRDAGGIGMILYNPTVNSLNADFHVVPTVHVGQVEGAAIKAYLASAGAKATASLSAVSTAVPRAPQVAAFSSPGPPLAGDGDLIKPDIVAPGVDVVAPVSPAGHHDNLFDGLSGTSMASPHIAGIAALLRSANPAWTPSDIKSALMTTAGQTDNRDAPIQREGGGTATPFDEGSGHVDPADAFDPGLVYRSGPADWIKYGCGIQQFQTITDWCDSTGAIDPSDLNYPSIAVGDLPGRQTVTRTVTNVSTRASVYVASTEAPAGFSVRVTPSTITVPPGGSVTFRVEVSRTDAAYGKWAFGALTWKDLRGHAVRSPIAVKPVALGADGEVIGHGAEGSGTVTVRGGYSGVVTARPDGPVPSTITTEHLVGMEHGFDPDAPKAGAGVGTFKLTVPAGARLGRVATYNADAPPDSDVDLYVYRDGKKVGQSAGGTADESVDVTTPGVYDVYVVQFALPVGAAGEDVKVHTFVVPATSAGKVTITPTQQPIGPNQEVTFLVTWTGLDPTRRYLGDLEFGDGKVTRASTLLSIGP
jgi:subtilisin family serine protease